MKAATFSLTPRSCRNLSNPSWTPPSSLGLELKRFHHTRADVKSREKSAAGPMYKPRRFQWASAVSSWLEKRDEVAHEYSSRDSKTNLKGTFGSQQAPEDSKHHQSNIPARGKLLHYMNEADEQGWHINQCLQESTKTLGSVSGLRQYKRSTYLGLGFNK